MMFRPVRQRLQRTTESLMPSLFQTACRRAVLATIGIRPESARAFRLRVLFHGTPGSPYAAVHGSSASGRETRAGARRLAACSGTSVQGWTIVRVKLIGVVRLPT